MITTANPEIKFNSFDKMVRDGTAYHNSQPTHHQAAANNARLKKIKENKKRKRQAYKGKE